MCIYLTPQGDKRTPSLEKGFLVQVVRYALNRLKSLNKFCVICDEKHVLESGLIKVIAHLLPSIQAAVFVPSFTKLITTCMVYTD